MAITKIGTPELFDFSATNTALQLPTGPTTGTGGRPATPSTGEWRFNTTLKYVEFWDSTAWRQIDTESSAVFTAAENFNTNTYFGNGATQVIDAKFNEAANFNGTSSYISLPNDLINTNLFTVSCWINPFSVSSNDGILGAYGTNGVNYGWMIYLNNGVVNFVSYSSNGDMNFSQTGSLNINTWYHVAVTYSSTDCIIYINGANSNNLVPPGDRTYRPLDHPYRLGAVDDGGTTVSFFDGKIDQVRIFNTALPATGTASVATLYAETTTTAATLDFPAGAGCFAAYQLDGNGNDVGTTTATTVATYQLNGVTTSIPSNTYPGTASNITYTAGKFDNAAVFNGSDGQIELPNLGISGAGTRTISAWINVNSLSSTQTILQYGSNSAGQRFGFAIDTAGKLYVEYFGRDAITSSAQITTGSWFNVAVTYNGGAVETATNTQIYVNGSAVTMSTTGTLIGAANTADSNYGIGYDRANARQFFNGSIDQVRIFNTALPQSAVTVLSNETVATSSSASISYQGSTYNGTTTNVGYTGLQFQPDFVWLKPRSQADNHNLFDTIRGVQKQLISNNTSVESNQPNTLTAFNSDGFSIGPDNNINTSGQTYVAWCWKAGGAPTATNSAGAGNVPTAGSVKIDGVDSTTALAGATAATKISANTAAGFSIVSYTGPASNSTIGHGLGVKPSMIIQKPTGSGSWNVYFAPGVIDATSNYYFMVLNSSVSKATTSSAGPTITTFNSAGTGAHIAYCFADIAGYQKIGSYSGVSTGPRTHVTGFEPSFVMIKSSNASQNWYIYDNKRRPPLSSVLFPDLADSEYNTDNPDLYVTFVSGGAGVGGFKTSGVVSGIDGSGRTFIFLAIA